MSGKDDSRWPQRRIDAAAKAAFLGSLRRGERREDAAAAAGFSMMGFYGARGRDPAFKAEWVKALATSAAAERRLRAYAGRGTPGEARIASANRRIYQRRWHRNVRFTAERQAIFLAHFALTCDTTAAAAAAGVSESTITYHCRHDPAFAEAYAQALQEGYVFLEAEALRLRLAAQKKLRAAIEAAGDTVPPRLAACPECGRVADDRRSTAEEGAEFDRIMKLLARWDRKPRRVDSRFKEGGRRQRWTFEEAIALLDKKLRALGVRISAPPPAEE
ncbi:MAG: hypothetical protein QOD42_3259 [Sphingomonadales bacterium]|jgi:hypothetical protein|nr:hypothetical protein [Sphingomonadales bacterium]